MVTRQKDDSSPELRVLGHNVLVFLFIALILFLSFVASPALLADEKVPDELQGVGITEHMGSLIDKNLAFKDEQGHAVTLRQYFSGEKPVLLFLVYFECPNLCTFILNGAIDSLQQIDWTPGKQFEILAVSIDPREKPDLALRKRAAYHEMYGKGSVNEGWHFLTGDQANINALAKQVGYSFKWDPEQKQFAHASAFFVLTPDGKLSRYFYGITYPPKDLKLSMLEASQGRLGSVVDKFLMFCYHYDGSTKRYVLLANRIMTIGGAITVVVLVLGLGLLWRRERLTT